MTASASILGWRSRRRAKNTALRLPILAPYTGHFGPSWVRRHRRLCLFALGFFSFFYGIVWALGGPYALPLLIVPLIPVTAMVIWQLPETGRVNERLIAGWFFAFVIGLNCWPDYVAIDLPLLPWMTVIRIIGIPLTLLFIVSLSRSRQYRTQLLDVLSASPVISWCVALFAVIMAYSVALSDEPFFSLSRMVIAQINWTAMFFIGCAVFAIPGNVHRFAMILWLTTLFVCLVALTEEWLDRVPWAGHLPAFLSIADAEAIMAGAVRFSTGLQRLMAKFTTPLALGEFLTLTSPFVLHVAFAHSRPLIRLAAIATLPMIVYVAMRTDSRLAVIGLLSAAGWYTLYWALTVLKRDRKSIVASVTTMAYPLGIAVLLAATFFIGRIRNRVWGNYAHQASNDARSDMYRDGIPLILKNPLGYGMGQGGSTLNYHLPNGMLTIDTYYLAVALEFGVLGFIVYYSCHVVAVVKAAKLGLSRDGEFTWLGPVAIALFNFVLSKSVLSQMENHPLAFMMMGLVVAMSYRALKEPPPPQLPTHSHVRP